VADHAEVELDTTGGPGAAQSDVPKLENLVPVDELVAGLLDDRSPYLAPDLGKDKDLDQVVLESDYLPIPRL
jgi:hypothetical protein